MGIYKSTNGGDSWTLLPGSVTAPSNFRGRAVSDITIAPNGDIIVGVARAIRGLLGQHGRRDVEPAAVDASGELRRLPLDGRRRDVLSDLGCPERLARCAASRTSSSTRTLRRRSTPPPSTSASGGRSAAARSRRSRPRWLRPSTPTGPSSRSTSSRAARLGCTSSSGTRGFRRRVSGEPTTRRALRVFTDMTTPQVEDFCTGQCWYDSYVISPAGSSGCRLRRRLVQLRPAGVLRRRLVERSWRPAVDGRRLDVERPDAGRRPRTRPKGSIRTTTSSSYTRTTRFSSSARRTAVSCVARAASSTSRTSAISAGSTRPTTPTARASSGVCRTRS